MGNYPRIIGYGKTSKGICSGHVSLPEGKSVLLIKVGYCALKFGRAKFLRKVD